VASGFNDADERRLRHNAMEVTKCSMHNT